jgi:hypothetical protein
MVQDIGVLRSSSQPRLTSAKLLGDLQGFEPVFPATRIISGSGVLIRFGQRELSTARSGRLAGVQSITIGPANLHPELLHG